MPEHREQADELLADFRRSREQLARVQGELAEISERASSPDGLVDATVGPRGTLTDLRIDDAAYRVYRPAELAEQIVRVSAEATVRALRRAGETLAPALGDDTDPQALLLGTGDLRAEELQPPRGRDTAVTNTEIEETFEQHSWVRED